MKAEIQVALLEAISVLRWNKDKTAMHAVLTDQEENKMLKDIIEELDNAGYEIVNKS